MPTETTADTLAPFIAECCTLEPDALAVAATLYRAYRRHTLDTGDAWPMTQTAFGKRLGAWFDRVMQGGITHYRGIALKPRG